MADYDSSDLLLRLKRTLAIEENAADADDTKLYVLLSDAQREVMQKLAALAPWSQYGAPELLTTADGGYTYTFAFYPLGHTEIRESRTGAVLVPVTEWSNAYGYVREGQTIRFPNNTARTFAAGPYARYVRRPTSISASVEPVLKPDWARQAIVYKAAAEYCYQGGGMDPTPYERRFQTFMYGDAETPGDLGLVGALQTAMHGAGYEADTPASVWWRSGDFGR